MALLTIALLTEGLAPDPVARIPFELTGSHAFIDVELDDAALSFAFDTGAGGVAINRAAAERLGLEATGRGSVTGTAGTTQVPLVDGLELQLDRLRIEGVTAAVVALGHLEEVIGRRLLRARVPVNRGGAPPRHRAHSAQRGDRRCAGPPRVGRNHRQ